MGVTVSDPKRVYSYNTSANKGAIWAPGGPAGDGFAVFVGTGNTEGALLQPLKITWFSRFIFCGAEPTDLFYLDSSAFTKFSNRSSGG